MLLNLFVVHTPFRRWSSVVASPSTWCLLPLEWLISRVASTLELWRCRPVGEGPSQSLSISPSLSLSLSLALSSSPILHSLAYTIAS